MLSKTLSRFCFVVGVVFCVGFLFSINVIAASTVAGTVYDKQRNTLPEIELELLNDYYQTVQRTKTDGAGRYHFNGLRDGRYTIRAFAFRYDLMDQEIPQEIQTQNIRGGEGSVYFVVDFYLQPKKGGLAEAEIGVIFAQDVPEAAKKAYEQGLKDLSSRRLTDGIANLNQAVQIFPQYYMALHRIGRELYILKKYPEAAQFLIEAAKVNEKSAYTLYYLGNCFHFMGKEYNKVAVTALNQAYVLAPGSTQVLYALGRVERTVGKFVEAEKHLLQAKKLSKVSIPEIHKELAQLYADDLKKYNEAADELELYLKAIKLGDSETSQTKKVIAGLREKAKVQPSKN